MTEKDFCRLYIFFIWDCLTDFKSIFHFCTPEENIRKPVCLMFLGVIEIEQ